MALAVWEQVLERSRAEMFSQDMLNYEHALLFSVLSAAKRRWEEKIVRRRFVLWRRSVRLLRKAENEVLHASVLMPTFESHIHGRE